LISIGHTFDPVPVKIKRNVGSIVKHEINSVPVELLCLRLEWNQNNCKLHESLTKELYAHKISLVLLQRINDSRYAFIYINNITNVTKLKQYWSNQRKRFIANLFAIITKPFALKILLLNICNGQMPCTASRNSWELCFDSMTTTFMHTTSVTCWKWQPAFKLQIPV